MQKEQKTALIAVAPRSLGDLELLGELDPCPVIVKAFATATKGKLGYGPRFLVVNGDGCVRVRGGARCRLLPSIPRSYSALRLKNDPLSGFRVPFNSLVHT